jgi:hypothetical protein
VGHLDVPCILLVLSSHLPPSFCHHGSKLLTSVWSSCRDWHSLQQALAVAAAAAAAGVGVVAAAFLRRTGAAGSLFAAPIPLQQIYLTP